MTRLALFRIWLVTNSVIGWPTTTIMKAEKSICGSFLSISECKCHSFDTDLICCNVNDASQFCSEETSLIISSIQIMDSSLSSLRLDQNFFDKVFIKDVSTIKRIEISRTSIAEIQICIDDEKEIKISDEDRHQVIPCKKFSNLQTLDLRENRLKTLQKMKLDKLKDLFLSGNDWHCFNGSSRQPVSDLEWLKPMHETIRDSDSTFCSRPWSNKWHQSNQKTNITIIKMIEFTQKMDETCPSGCICKIMNINDPLLVKVNCSNTNLVELPKVLPPNTQILSVANNQIQSLAVLRDNPHYSKLKQLIADGNNITSISELAGSPFVNNKPSTLTLQSNKLTKFDISFLRDLLSKVITYHESINFMFAYNPWECSCSTVQEIQDFIYTYKSWLKDSDFITCKMDETHLLITFDYSSFCIDESPFDYLSIVVGFEVFLFVLVVSKLVFDVWKYKRTGQLPWLARNICLGCNYSGLKDGSNSKQRAGGRSGYLNGQPRIKYPERVAPNHKIIQRTMNWLKCTSDNSPEIGETVSLNNLSKGPNQISFRPRRQTEKSSFSESIFNNVRVSSDPLETVPLRTLSNFASGEFSHSLKDLDYLETVSLSHENPTDNDKRELRRFSK